MRIKEEKRGVGILGYEVEFKEEGEVTWREWLTVTTETDASFRGLPKHTYRFRIRAVDRVGNTSTWDEGGPVTIESVTKYYTFGGQRVAMRQGEQVYYLHGDHLGSTSLTTDNTGALVSEVRYHP